MPVTTGPQCIATVACPVLPLPQALSVCEPLTKAGGVNDLYFVPCTETVSEANITDTAWWTTLKTDGKLGNLGLGLGSIAKKSDKKLKVASCRPEQMTGITWALKYIIRVMDNTAADTTTEQVNAILRRYKNFQLIARMCEGNDVILPIGQFSVSDFNWEVPEDSEDVQAITLELSWTEFAKPKTYTVAGLSAVVPKA